jgi:uncharacterized membrane protein
MANETALHWCQLASIVLSALVTGVFFGPWLGLSRSIDTFPPDVFLAIGHRMIANLGSVMPILMPAAILSIVPVVLLTYGTHAMTFDLTLAGLGLFVVALVITLAVEVPIDNQIRAWTVTSLPSHWQELRDRWEFFHVLRTFASVAGLGLIVAGAVFG